MNITELKRKIFQAERAKIKLDRLCDFIAEKLQPFFDEEINVFHQNGDGLVVFYDDAWGECVNIPVDTIYEAIKQGETNFEKYAI